MRRIASRAHIIVPTFRRPLWLRKCILSCFSQAGLDPQTLELLVVDNSPEASASVIVSELSRGSPIPIRYVHEVRPGISYARNAGLDQAAGELVAFIDDDEFATDTWLACLLETATRHRADVVFGPVIPLKPGHNCDLFDRRLSTGIEIESTILTPFWERKGNAHPPLASNNVLIHRRSEKVRALRYDPRLGQTGGEDTLYFNQLMVDGARLIWCEEAVVWEHVPADCERLGYNLLRAFRGGQSLTLTPLLLSPRRPSLAALSMGIALAQVPVFFSLALLSSVFASSHRNRHLARLASAVGKLFWGAPFRLRAYGPN